MHTSIPDALTHLHKDKAFKWILHPLTGWLCLSWTPVYCSQTYLPTMIIPHQRSALGLHPPLKSPPTIAFWIVALAVLLIATFHVQVAQAVTYNISVNLPILTGGKRDANMALFIRANAEATLAGIDPTGQHSFNLVYYSTNGTARNATLATQAAIAEHNVVGVIGDRTSTLTIPMVLIGSKTYTWFCSGGSTSVLLSDKSLYFNFMRTIPQDSIQGEFMAGFVYAMGYRTVSVISSAEVYGASVSTTFITTAERLGITILVNQVFQTSSTNYSLPLKAIEESGSRIIIGCILSDFSLQLLRQAKAAGLIGPNYVWVMPHAISGYSTIATQQADRELANGLLYVFPKEESLNAGYNGSLQRFNQRYPGEPIPPLSFYYLDCLTTLAKGILRIAGDSGPSAVLDRSYYPDLNKYFLHPFVGVSGDVVFDDQGNRIVPFQVFNFWNGTAKAVYDVLPDLSVRQIAPIRFFSGTSDVPAEMPDRDLLYVAWLSPLGIALVVANALTLLAIVTAWAYLFANHSKPTVKPLSFPFLSIISLGCACVLMSNIASFGIPTLATCQTRLVLFSSGITMVLTSCAMKAFRIWTIFTSQVLLSNKLLRTSGMMSMTAAILVGQLALLAIWGGISPQRPIRVATKAFISYSCASIDRTVNSVFVSVICVYNAVLLSAIILFSYRTRNVPSTFSESTWNFNTAQMIAVISPLVGCLALFDFGSSTATLVAIAVKQVVILLTTIVVFGALIGRIALVTYVVNSQTGSTTGSKVGPPAKNARRLTPDPVGRHSAHSNSGPGQKGVSSAGTEVAVSKLRGVFPVSALGSLRVKWAHQEVWLSLDDGLLGIIPTTASVAAASQDQAPASSHSLVHKSQAASVTGKVLRLSTMRYNPDPSNQTNCIEVITSGAGYVIQFTSPGERSDWVNCLTRAGAVVQNSHRPSSAAGAHSSNHAADGVGVGDASTFAVSTVANKGSATPGSA